MRHMVKLNVKALESAAREAKKSTSFLKKRSKKLLFLLTSTSPDRPSPDG